MKAEALPSAPGAAPPSVGWFEFWPGWLFYAPVVAQWIFLGLRYGDMSLPTAANPEIEFGGLCGESKATILDQLTGPDRNLIAPYAVLTAGRLDAAEEAMRIAGLCYPIVAKPDIGCNGTGVRLLHDQAGLAAYLRAFPAERRLLLQHFVSFEGEAGIFYIRRPGEAHGRITSLTLKHPPVVFGDGRSTLRDLVLADPRAGRIAHIFLPRLGARLDTVPASGERVKLAFVGNHCKGSLFEDAGAHITPALTERIEQMARALPDFHFGRFDVRYESVAGLRQGAGFMVIEINGVGSEATHIWDPRTRLRHAWRDQFQHYGAAFAIGKANRARGARPSGLIAMARAFRLQSRLLASYPSNN